MAYKAIFCTLHTLRIDINSDFRDNKIYPLLYTTGLEEKI